MTYPGIRDTSAHRHTPMRDARGVAWLSLIVLVTLLSPRLAAADEPAPDPLTPLSPVIQALGAADDQAMQQLAASYRKRLEEIAPQRKQQADALPGMETELAQLEARTKLLEAVVAARGDQPPRAAGDQPPADINGLLDKLLSQEKKALDDHLAALKKSLDDKRAAVTAARQAVTAFDSELATLQPRVAMLDALLTARRNLAAVGFTPPAPPAPPAAATPEATPPATEGAMTAAPVVAENAQAMAPPAAPAEVPAAAPTEMPAAAAAEVVTPETPAAPPAASADTAAMSAPPVAPPATVRLVNYTEHVAPIFAARCTGCHNPDKAKGGLSLATIFDTMRGGGSGAVISPGDPDGSRLFRLVAHTEEPTMPPLEDRIDDASLETIRLWIEQGGATDVADAAAKAAAVAAESGNKLNTPTPIEPPQPVDEALAMSATPTALQPNEIDDALRDPPVRSVAISPTAPVIAVAAESFVHFYNVDDGAPLGVIRFEADRVARLVFSSDGMQLWIAGGTPGKSGFAAAYSVADGRELLKYDQHFDAVQAMAVSADDGLIALGGCNRKVRVFDTFDATQLFEINHHNDWVLALAFSPDGLLLASGDRSGSVMVWEADTGREVFDLRPDSGMVHALAFSPDSRKLAVAGDDGRITWFDMNNGRAGKRANAHGGKCLDLAYLPDGRLLSSGSDGKANVWKGNGGKQKSLDGLSDWVYGVCFGVQSGVVAAGDWTGATNIWNLKDGALLRTLRPAR